MNAFEQFAAAAKDLSRNPLGIIALFIVLIYGFACLVIGMTILSASERLPIIWFLVLFPVLVLAVFAWLVTEHHTKLYAPRDFQSDQAFIDATPRRVARPEVAELDQQIEQKISQVLESEEMVLGIQDAGEVRSRLKQAAVRIKTDIKEAAFFSVDISEFSELPSERIEFPISAFARFSDLTNEIYFRISKFVKAYEYGYSWVLRDEKSGNIIRNLRMLTNVEAGKPLSDNRTLKEVGIYPGMVLLVTRPAPRELPDSNR